MPRPKLYPTKYPNLKRTTARHREGQSRYYGDFRVRKIRYRPPLGILTQEAALIKLKGIIHQKKMEVTGGIQGGYTLEGALEAYRVAHKGHVREATYEAWCSSDSVLNRWFPDQIVAEIDRGALRRRLAEQHERYSAYSANRILKRLRQVVKWLIEEGKLAASPIRGVKTYPLPEGRIRWLLESEEDRLRAACTSDQWRWFEFAILTGFRQKEQLTLKWSDITPSHIVLRASVTKSGRSRRLPILPRLRKLLEGRREATKGDYVWASPSGKPWRRANFRYQFWRPLMDKAGLEDMVWHDLRHTFCSRLVQGGAPINVVCTLAGHSDIAITMRYAHLAPSNLEEALEILE